MWRVNPRDRCTPAGSVLGQASGVIVWYASRTAFSRLRTALAECGTRGFIRNCGSVHRIVHEIRHATSQLLRGELMEARVTAQSQGLKLRERMEEAKIQHGQEVRVDLPRIAVTAMAGGTAGEVFFCRLGAIRVREVRNPGNDRPLPTTVRLEGLTVPHSGGTTSSTPWCTRTGISGSWWTPRPRWCPRSGTSKRPSSGDTRLGRSLRSQLGSFPKLPAAGARESPAAGPVGSSGGRAPRGEASVHPIAGGLATGQSRGRV